MGTMESQITSLTAVYSTVYSDVDQRKHQSSASLAFVIGIDRWPLNSPHKGPVTRKMFPFDDVIMDLRWIGWFPAGGRRGEILCIMLMCHRCLYSSAATPAWWRHRKEHFPCYWPFVRGIHLTSMNPLYKGQWRGALMFSLTCAWINVPAIRAEQGGGETVELAAG